MLERVDRVQLAVRDRAAALQSFVELFAAEPVREDELRLANARRTVLQAGESEFELLEPAGEGAVATHLEQWGEGIFAAGFSTADLPGLASHLAQKGIAHREEGEQLFIDPAHTRGMRMVISPGAPRRRLGRISYLYEVTNIVQDHREAASFYAGSFRLDSSRFSPIASDRYGYTGTLTLFDPPARLDRIELTQITDPAGAMGRFFGRRGPSVYMCFAEAPDVRPIIERLQARGARYTADSEFPNEQSLFVHPTALHGVLMGISRTNLAWTWSGRPELARA